MIHLPLSTNPKRPGDIYRSIIRVNERKSGYRFAFHLVDSGCMIWYSLPELWALKENRSELMDCICKQDQIKADIEVFALHNDALWTDRMDYLANLERAIKEALQPTITLSAALVGDLHTGKPGVDPARCKGVSIKVLQPTLFHPAMLGDKAA